MNRIRYLSIVAFMLLSFGCAYKSVIIHAPAKRIHYRGMPTDVAPKGGSILDHPLNLPDFFEHPHSSLNVDYQGILYNPDNGRYLQWQFLRKAQDSTELYVKFQENHKNTSTDFVLSVSNYEFGRPSIEPIQEGGYILTLPAKDLTMNGGAGPGADKGSGEISGSAKLLITRSQNFVLADTLLHMWTGEVNNLHGGRCEFVILNDVEDPQPICSQMFIFTSFLTDMAYWSEKCDEVHSKECREKGLRSKYKAAKQYHYLYTMFSIVCEGSCIPK